MHYKNGREAHNGDRILVSPSYGKPYIGILYDAVAGNNDCNGRVAIPTANDPMPDLKDCVHVEDVVLPVSV